MGQQYLIDSNAVIDYLAGKFPERGMFFMNKIINEVPFISIITKEVLEYKTTDEAYQLLSSFMEDSVIIGLSDEIVERTIEIRKMNKIKIPDAIIAATALTRNLKLISRNKKDFDKIDMLEIVNPYEI
ncbi:MAG: type II toxin-antitoxin system VapC family toxin [Bacteroidales bacterium]